MVPFLMTFRDLQPTFQGQDNIQRQITRLIVTIAIAIAAVVYTGWPKKFGTIFCVRLNFTKY